LTKKVLID